MQQPAFESAADRRPAEPELQKLAAGDDAVLGGGELRKQPVDRELPDLRVGESSTRLIPLGGINAPLDGHRAILAHPVFRIWRGWRQDSAGGVLRVAPAPSTGARRGGR